MALLFTHLSGEHKGRVDRFPDAIERLRIGRASDCEVRVSPTDTVVSSHHAVINSTPRGYVLQDLASRNGTMLNGQPVERAPLTSGDSIQFGYGGPEVRFEIASDQTRVRVEGDFLILAQLLESADLLNKYMSSYLADFGLTSSKFNTLQVLSGTPERAVTQNELGSRLTVTGASITGALDRLERDNLVARASHPSDRRANLVRLTDQGESLVEAASDLHAARMNDLMSVLDADEREALSQLLAKLIEATKKKL